MPEPKKTLYLVSTGDYSDYQVRAIFSDREKAAAWAQDYCHQGANDIEEYPLDPEGFRTPEGLVPFEVHIRISDGYVSYVKADEEETSTGTRTVGISDPFLFVSCYARDTEHAIKIAGEKRIAALLAAS